MKKNFPTLRNLLYSNIKLHCDKYQQQPQGCVAIGSITRTCVVKALIQSCVM